METTAPWRGQGCRCRAPSNTPVPNQLQFFFTNPVATSSSDQQVELPTDSAVCFKHVSLEVPGGYCFSLCVGQENSSGSQQRLSLTVSVLHPFDGAHIFITPRRWEEITAAYWIWEGERRRWSSGPEGKLISNANKHIDHSNYLHCPLGWSWD